MFSVIIDNCKMLYNLAKFENLIRILGMYVRNIVMLPFFMFKNDCAIFKAKLFMNHKFNWEFIQILYNVVLLKRDDFSQTTVGNTASDLVKLPWLLIMFCNTLSSVNYVSNGTFGITKFY